MSCHRIGDGPSVELADIFRATYERLELFGEQDRAVRAIINCRTRVLGGHLYECHQCGSLHKVFNSCDNRHCPKCQGLSKARWLKKRLEEVLPVIYFHIVFTLPSQLNPIALRNQRLFYALFFRCMAETLLEAAANPDNLGAQIGFLAILHTWGQTLVYHPHIHCVVAGGGISEGDEEWIPSRKNFFISVKKLSRLFRGKFLAALKTEREKGTLVVPEDTWELLNGLHQAEWVVYAKKPFGGPKNVLDYLGRYVHRVAISNNRILEFKDDQVSFKYRDYHDNLEKVMVLSALEFCRRFLFHILPLGFTRIRYFGFMANRVRKKNLRLVRRLLWELKPFVKQMDNASMTKMLEKVIEKKPMKCPNCENGELFLIARLSRVPP